MDALANSPTPDQLAAHGRLILLAMRSYERCHSRSDARTADGWSAICGLLWSALQGPGLVLLPLGSERRRRMADRYHDADYQRRQLRRIEADARAHWGTAS